MNQTSAESVETKQTLIYTFINLLKICHPFMPFVTEELNNVYKKDKSLLVSSSWPELIANGSDQSKSIIDFLINTITEVRSIRSELRVAPSNKIKLLVMNSNNNLLKALKDNVSKLERMARLSSLDYVEKIPDNAIQFNVAGLGFGLDLKGIVNAEEELVRLGKELQKVENEIFVVENKLNNKQFLENAPKDVIDKQKKLKTHLLEQKAQIDIIQGKIKIIE